MKPKPLTGDHTIDARRLRARERARDRRAKDPAFAARDRENSRAYSRRKMLESHGLTEDEFERLLAQQNYACAICHDPFTIVSGGRSRSGKPHVDHDHATGKVRGLLCLRCNSVLGHARDNLTILASAKDYLSLRNVNAARRGWKGTVAGKVWGATSALISNPLLELHRIVVLPNAQCSLHMHQHKRNTFIVLSGVLFVDVHKNDYALIDTTELYEGDVMTVEPGENHRFRTTIVGAEALEIYHQRELDARDIVRRDCGGVNGVSPE